jgi:phage shock protein A
MCVAEVAAFPFVRDGEGAIVALRREAVEAVARQQRLRAEVRAARAQAVEIEDEARRALAAGDGLLARQILARGICALEVRDQLERDLEESRRLLARVLGNLVRTEDRAWGLRRAVRWG